MSSNQQLSTPKSQLGINYAKLRNKTKKHNNSSIENKEQAKPNGQYNGIFDTMNQANLNYIETLITNKQQHRKQYDSHFELDKRNHQRAKSTLEEKQTKKTDDQQMSYRESVNSSTLSPNNVQTTTNRNQHNYMRQLNKSSFSEYSKPNLSVLSHNESALTDKFPRHNQDSDNEKLFDQFFKLNNSKSDSDFLRESQQIMMNQMTHIDEDSNKKQIAGRQDFMKFLDHSIGYLQKSESDFKSLPSKFQVPLAKQISKELSLSQNENKMLKMTKDQLENKVREQTTAKNFLFKECQIMKQREDDFKETIKMLKYDNHTLKKKYQELAQKSSYFEELINQQRIDNENSMMALKQVQALHSKQGHFKDQDKKYSSYNEQNFRRNQYEQQQLQLQNKVIEETHSSTNDDEKVSDYQFDYELRKENSNNINNNNNNFQTNHSQDYDMNDFTMVGGKFTANQMYEFTRQQKHNKMIEEDIQKMLVQKYYKSNSKKQEMMNRQSSQMHNQRKKSQRDKLFSNEVFQFFNEAQP